MEQGSLEKELPKKRGLSRAKLFTIIGAVILVVVGLAVGLGVGLTRHHDDGSSDDSGDSSDSSDSGSSSQSVQNNNTNLVRKSLWQPAAGTDWQIILIHPVTSAAAKSPSPKVPVYDLDLWDNSAANFASLHAAGKKVICYFSAGSYENWRPDKGDFKDSDLGEPLDGWPGEKWVDVKSANVRKIMSARIKMAAGKGCDAIDPDNVDAYQNENGLGLTEDDAVDYMRFLASEAKKYNMSTGLKNAGDIIPRVVSFLHFSVNEQCVQYGECETFAPWVKAGKPVFNIEYPDGAPAHVSDAKRQEICSRKGQSKGADKFSTVIKTMDLDGWVEYCDGKTYTTPIQKGT